MLVFWDEAGFSQRPSIRRTWAPRGHTPVLTQPFNWKRLSAMGAIAWRPWQANTRLFLSLRPGSIDGNEVIGFLRHLRRHVAGTVVLIWDGLPPHHSGRVKDYLDSQRQWLTVERLPAYAPELNPVEGLWSALNAKATANYSPDTLEEVGGQLRAGLRRLRRQDTMASTS